MKNKISIIKKGNDRITADKRKKYCLLIICSLVIGEVYVIYRSICSYSEFMNTYGNTLGRNIIGKMCFFYPILLYLLVYL